MAETTDIRVPAELEGTKAVVRAWLKRVGEPVKRDEPLVELETDKVATEVPSPADGILAEILLDADADATPGAVLGRLDAARSQAATPEALSAPPRIAVRATPVRALSSDVVREHRLSPAVRRALSDRGLDPAAIAGTGRDGRITRADVDAYAPGAFAPAPSPAVTPPPSSDGPASSRLVPHDRMRRLIAENMIASVTAAPHVTAVFEADFGAIMAHRVKHRDAFEREGISLTYTAYLVAGCVAAMRAVPSINSRWRADHLELFDDVNIGIGTALGDKGLVVPVVHRAQTLTLSQIAARLQDVTSRARAGQLKPADMKDGTFSISNHGVSGSLIATPIIIQQPQSAILGVGALEKRVVVRSVDGVDSIQIRPMAYVSLTIDHRVIDGHQTNLWLRTFVDALEQWR